MEQIAFTMKLIPGQEDEYEKRHQEIWPEMVDLLKAAGIAEYHIYLDPSSSTLFAVQKKAAGSSSQELGNLEIVQKWWAYMADIMDTNPDKSPVTRPLKQVFKL